MGSDNKNDCIIQELREVPFLKRDVSEQQTIFDKGRPTPAMPGLTKRYVNTNRRFNVRHYTRYEWLTGSPKLNKLFCWYCLLFESEKMAGKFLWASGGYSNMRQLIMAANRHAFSQNHHKNMIKYHKYQNKDKKDIQIETERVAPTVEKFNVKKANVRRCIINQILGRPFLERTLKEQIEIIQNGRPTPPMPLLFLYDINVKTKIGFQSENYLKFKWMCGSQKLNRLYCWYCLLFADPNVNEPWISVGFNKMDEFFKAADKHTSLKLHVEHERKYEDFKTSYNISLNVPVEPQPRSKYPSCDSEISTTVERLEGDDNNKEYTDLSVYKPENYPANLYPETQNYINSHPTTDLDYTTSFENYYNIQVNRPLQMNLETFNYSTYNTLEAEKPLLQNLDGKTEIEELNYPISFNSAKPELDPVSGLLVENKVPPDTNDDSLDEVMNNSCDNFDTMDGGDDSSVTTDEDDDNNDGHYKSTLTNLDDPHYTHPPVVNQQSTESEHCLVSQLLKTRFGKLPEETQKQILTNGRPVPDTLQFSKLGNKFYNRFDFLTASTETKRFYCWTCLLMKEPFEMSFWGEEGIEFARNVPKRLEKHANSTIHITCTTRFTEVVHKLGVYLRPVRFIPRENEKPSTIELLERYKNDNTCIVVQLLRNSFQNRTSEEQHRMIDQGRPTPKLNLYGVYCGTKRNFRPIYYEKYEWLCGSSKLNKLFCWYCLLYRKSVWGREGVSNINKLTESLKKHDASTSHQMCTAEFIKFGKTDEEFHQTAEMTKTRQIVSNILSNSKRCLINELLGYPFTMRPIENKLEIVKNDRPIPDASDGEPFISNFFNINYYKYTWLTGSKKLKKLFCWPCLLFADPASTNVWVQTGFDTVRKLSTAAGKHENSKTHLKHIEKYKRFKRQHSAMLESLTQLKIESNEV